MPNMRTAVDRAFERYQLATCLITENDRPAAADQMRAAIRNLEGHRGADGLRRDLEELLAGAILRRTA